MGLELFWSEGGGGGVCFPRGSEIRDRFFFAGLSKNEEVFERFDMKQGIQKNSNILFDSLN